MQRVQLEEQLQRDYTNRSHREDEEKEEDYEKEEEKKEYK